MRRSRKIGKALQPLPAATPQIASLTQETTAHAFTLDENGNLNGLVISGRTFELASTQFDVSTRDDSWVASFADMLTAEFSDSTTDGVTPTIAPASSVDWANEARAENAFDVAANWRVLSHLLREDIAGRYRLQMEVIINEAMVLDLNHIRFNRCPLWYQRRHWFIVDIGSPEHYPDGSKVVMELHERV